MVCRPGACRAFAKKLNDAPLAIVDKRRSAHNVSEVMNLIGDVRGKVAVLVDDMIDTAGTITNAAKVRPRPPRGSSRSQAAGRLHGSTSRGVSRAPVFIPV